MSKFSQPLILMAAMLMLAVSTTFVSSRLVAEEGTPEVKSQNVVFLKGPQTVSVEKGQLVRVSGSTPSGGKLTIAITGPGKLVREATLRTYQDGQPMIGALIKEYDIETTAAGQLEIVVSRYGFNPTEKPLQDKYTITTK